MRMLQLKDIQNQQQNNLWGCSLSFGVEVVVFLPESAM
jgi:hypothetical protein